MKGDFPGAPTSFRCFALTPWTTPAGTAIFVSGGPSMKFIRIIPLLLFAISLAVCGFSQQPLEGRKHPLSQTEQDLMKQAKISLDEAKKIALKKAPGTIFHWELEKENGRVIYSIEIQLSNDKKYS